ncbi:L,D-transpeptidase family protein [Gordonia malaquae]|uniref:L,D-transpeptidase family protein n=2 Tax=Gordonia malaquae TaxID=410332 RepID=UPI0030FEEFE8
MMLKLLMRRVWQLGLLATAAVVALVVGTGSASAAPATPAPAPGASDITTLIETILKSLNVPGLPGGTTPQAADATKQMVVVTAPVATSQTATLTAFEKDDAGVWKPVIGPTKAWLGEKGMGKAQDNVYRTPQGTFPLDQAFGRQENPGTKMPYFKADTQDWWDSDPKSPTYNTHVRQAQSPGGDSENLYNMGPVYDYAVNVAHNPNRVPGDASAIFLHVSDNQPTWGCIAIERQKMIDVLKWLDPTKSPKITIGVNVDAPKDAPAPEASPNGDIIGGVLGNLAALIPDTLKGLIPTTS